MVRILVETGARVLWRGAKRQAIAATIVCGRARVCVLSGVRAGTAGRVLSRHGQTTS